MIFNNFHWGMVVGLLIGLWHVIAIHEMWRRKWNNYVLLVEMREAVRKDGEEAALKVAVDRLGEKKGEEFFHKLQSGEWLDIK